MIIKKGRKLVELTEHIKALLFFFSGRETIQIFNASIKAITINLTIAMFENSANHA